MKKKRKPQYYRFTVDQIIGKMTEHSITLTSSSPSKVHPSQEYYVAKDHAFVDEVVIGNVIHLEAMDRRTYWINVAGVTLWVKLRKDGTVKSVTVYGPGEYDEPVDGVKYEGI